MRDAIQYAVSQFAAFAAAQKNTAVDGHQGFVINGRFISGNGQFMRRPLLCLLASKGQRLFLKIKRIGR